MSLKKKLIKVLIILAISIPIISVIYQCSTEDKEPFSISSLKNKSYYSFIIETPESILYSTPHSSELKINTSKNKKNLIFEDELKKFNKYKIPLENEDFQNLYISNSLGETNFANNHLFEYDVKINNSNKVFANIYYPYGYKGSYEFMINDDTKNLISKIIHKLSSEKTQKIDSFYSNVIILQTDNKNQSVFGGEYFINNSIEYSLLLAITNKILLENINENTSKIDNLDLPSKQYINHLKLPPPPPSTAE